MHLVKKNHTVVHCAWNNNWILGGGNGVSISEEELFNIPYSMRQTQDLGQVSGGRPGIFISPANFNKRAADEQMIAVQIMPRNPCPTAFCVDTSLHNSCIFFHMGFSSREEQYMCCSYFVPSKLACWKKEQRTACWKSASACYQNIWQ